MGVRIAPCRHEGFMPMESPRLNPEQGEWILPWLGADGRLGSEGREEAQSPRTTRTRLSQGGESQLGAPVGGSFATAVRFQRDRNEIQTDIRLENSFGLNCYRRFDITTSRITKINHRRSFLGNIETQKRKQNTSKHKGFERAGRARMREVSGKKEITG